VILLAEAEANPTDWFCLPISNDGNASSPQSVPGCEPPSLGIFWPVIEPRYAGHGNAQLAPKPSGETPTAAPDPKSPGVTARESRPWPKLEG
jgi:hypothetical protein